MPNPIKFFFSFLFFSLFYNSVQCQLIEVLNDQEIAGIDYSSNLVFNLVNNHNIQEVKFVKINDIIERQNNGKLFLTISDESIKSQKIQAKKVEYIDLNNYVWAGNGENQNLATIFIKDNNGYSGSIFDYSQGLIYRIYPINEEISALIKTVSGEGALCEISNIEPYTPHFSEDCEDNCPGHVDILFLLPVDVQDFIGNAGFNHTFLNLFVTELELTFANSNITNTVDYTWAEFDWDIGYSDDDNCQSELNDLKNSTEALALKEAHNADIIVLLKTGRPWPLLDYGVLGCVPIGFQEPSENSGYTIMLVEKMLGEPLFRHEVGHIFGAEHFDKQGAGQPIPGVDQFCHYAHKFSIDGKIYFTSVANAGDGNILHYSDPKIHFKGEPTGRERQIISNPYSTDEKPERNNAAKIRSTGCVIEAYTESPNVNSTILIDNSFDPLLTSCVLELNSNTQPANGDYEYLWNWSLDGIFTSTYPGLPLGTGNNIIVPEPVDSPCETYFIQLIVKLNDEIVEIEVISLEGAICVDYVDNPCPTPSTALTANNGASLALDSKFAYIPNHHNDNIDSRYIRVERLNVKK